jgi:hypothetical protein
VSDFEDRLAALDPAAAAPYQHRDLESMITRVTRQSASAKGRAWRNFQLKVAGAVVASALLTTGAIATFSSGPSLAVLALAGANHPPAAFSTSVAGSAMEIYEEFNFSAGAGLSTQAPTSPSYQLQIPANGSAEAARLATIFGVSGTPVNTNGDGSVWTVTDPAGDTLVYQNSGVPEWNYTAASSGPSSSSEAASLSALPSNAATDALARSYIQQLGYGYSLSDPSFGTSTTSQLNTDGSTASAVSTNDVSYAVLFQGITMNEQINFSVNANNTVADASGPAFSVGSPVNYPLQSPQAGVAALNAAQQSKFANTTTSTSGATTDAGPSTTTPSGPPIVNVTLNASSVTFGVYELTDGSVWLLPVYSYSGNATSASGTTATGTWSELAIDPSYVAGSANATAVNHGVVNF